MDLSTHLREQEELDKFSDHIERLERDNPYYALLLKLSDMKDLAAIMFDAVVESQINAHIDGEQQDFLLEVADSDTLEDAHRLLFNAIRGIEDDTGGES